MKKSVFIMFILSIILFSFSASAQKIEIIDGVKYIHNDKPIWGDNPEVKIEFLRTLGELEGEDENYQFFNPAGIARDSKGNFYVLDAGNCRIQKFDENFKFVDSIGNEGQGPVEFKSPRYITIDKKENIYINDWGNRRIQILTTEGEMINTIGNERNTIDFMFLK